MTAPADDGSAGVLYSLKAVLEKNPIQISGFIVAFVNWIILMGWLHMGDKQVGGLNTVLILGLGLFVSAKTENKRNLQPFLELVPPAPIPDPPPKPESEAA